MSREIKVTRSKIPKDTLTMSSTPDGFRREIHFSPLTNGDMEVISTASDGLCYTRVTQYLDRSALYALKSFLNERTV